MTERIPHIWTRYQDRRPFEDYQDQPDTEHKKLLEVRRIPFAMPEKKRQPSDLLTTPKEDAHTRRRSAAAAPNDSEGVP